MPQSSLMQKDDSERNVMRSHAETIKAAVWKAGAVSSRLYTSLIRTCLLNLIAQIVIGTPIAAQTLPNSQPALMDASRCIGTLSASCKSESTTTIGGRE
jgi:hypothetical protein